MRNKIESSSASLSFFLPLNNQSDFVEGINKKNSSKIQKTVI